MQGFINVYKPSGVTSAYIVNLIKRTYHIDKVGHMGTLDPMAQGVLPIAIGKATRMFDYFLQKTKTYVVKMQFGISTDTLDATGQIIDSSSVIPTLMQINEILPKFQGNIDQTPPKYSAKNIGGVRAYKLARNGEDVELKPNKVFIENIKILSFDKDILELQVTCGSGTYIRSLVRDIALELGTCANMIYLCRTSSGYFNVNNAVDLTKSYDLEQIIIPIEQVFAHIPTLQVDEIIATRLMNGQTVILNQPDGIYFVKHTELLGVMQIVKKHAKIKTFLKG